MTRTWLITGCSSGLGLEIARAALAKGDQVVLSARRPDTIDVSGMDPQRILRVRLDLQDPQSMEAAVQEAVSHFGGVDVLVNNAGRGYRAAVEEGEEETVRSLFETNFFGPMALIRLILPLMRARGGGLIINVSSIGGVRGALGSAYYSATKGALEMASDALRQEVQSFGIRVVIVEPGAMATGFFKERLEASRRSLSAYDTLGERYRKKADNTPAAAADPARCAQVLVDVCLSEDPPCRLLLGKDAVHAAEEVYLERLEELGKWRDAGVSCSENE